MFINIFRKSHMKIMNNPRNFSNVPLIKNKAYINGEWISSSTGKLFIVSNPANGDVLAEVPDMDETDVKSAIDSAFTAFEQWRNASAYNRSQILKRWHNLMVKNGESIAKIITLECGKPYLESVGEVNYGNSYIEYYSEEARRINGEILQSAHPSKKYFVEKQPIGVVGLITAFNFPLAMITRKAAAALSAGCTCVIKPATDTPLTALAMAELAEKAGMPKGVLNVITSSHSSNPKVVDVLCTSPRVRGISFTGSVQVGKIINEKCSHHIKRVSLELGGNAPFIVYNSANLDNAVKSVIAAKFRNSGQTCIAPNRFLIQGEIYNAFVDKLTTEILKLKVGDGQDQNVKIGPMINIGQLKKIENFVEDAINKGAKAVVGGKSAPLIGELFYEPTILVNVQENMKLYEDEIFGPVVSVLKFETEEESLAMANQPDVGLAGYIFSEDISQIFRVSRKLEVGMVGVNEGIISAPEIPFGGVKQSGIGREGGWNGVEEYIDYKYICLGNLFD